MKYFKEDCLQKVREKEKEMKNMVSSLESIVKIVNENKKLILDEDLDELSQLIQGSEAQQSKYDIARVFI